MKTQQNEYSNPEENNASFITRFWIYQRERFPLLAHGILISAFSFSAIAYSRISRGATGFISWQHFLVGVFTTVTLLVFRKYPITEFLAVHLVLSHGNIFWLVCLPRIHFFYWLGYLTSSRLPKKMRFTLRNFLFLVG